MQAAILPKLHGCGTIGACQERLIRLGARYIGSGYYAHVYSLEVMVMPPMSPVGYVPDSAWFDRPVEVTRETRVVKLARNDVGGLVTARAATMTYEVDPYAPRYYGFKALNFGYDWIGELELLSHTDAVNYGDGGHSEPAMHVTGEQFARKPTDEFMATSPFLRECVRQYHHERWEEEPLWDIHGRNIMMRGAQPVITDPISAM